MESNHRHKDFQSSALPTELSGQFIFSYKSIFEACPAFFSTLSSGKTYTSSNHRPKSIFLQREEQNGINSFNSISFLQITHFMATQKSMINSNTNRMQSTLSEMNLQIYLARIERIKQTHSSENLNNCIPGLLYLWFAGIPTTVKFNLHLACATCKFNYRGNDSQGF